VTDWSFDFLNDGTNTAVSTIGTVLAVALCSGGGIGGGGILVPLFILLDGYDEHYAIPLSKVVIFGAAITDFFLYRDMRHPVQKWRSLISYDLATIMEPLILGGTIIGVYLNLILPTYVIGTLLIVLLFFTSYRMFQKAFKLRQQERMEKELEEAAKAEPGSVGGSVSVMSASGKKRKKKKPIAESDRLLPGGAGIQSSGHPTGEVTKDNPQWEHVPWKRLLYLLFSWLSILVPAVLKDAVVECNSALYWAIAMTPFPLLAIVTAVYARILLREHKDRPQESYAKGDIKWGPREVVRYPILCSVAGVAAALLGVGGGMVTNPLMLELGVIPEVSRVTSAFMILFTSSCTSMQYLLLGKIDGDHMVWYFGFGFIGAILGHNVVEWILHKYHSTSVLVFILAVGVSASAVAMAATDIVDVVSNGFTSGGSVCS